jgi:hypothetical protein
MAPRSNIPNTDNNTREAGHSSRYRPPANTGPTTNSSGFQNTSYLTGFPSRRQPNGVHSLQAILGTDHSSNSSMQQRPGPGQFPALGWGHGHATQPPGSVPGSSTISSLQPGGAGPSSLRGFGQQPLVEPRSPTLGDVPTIGWASNSTLTQYPHNGHGNGSAGGSNGAAFYRTYQERDSSTTPRHHVMTPELNFAEIGHGRGTNHGAVNHRGYGDETRDGDIDDEDLVVVDAGNHTPLTPPSGYGSTNVVTPTPRRGYSVGDISHGDGSGTDERQGYFQIPFRHQMERDQGRHQPRQRARGVDHGPSASPQIRALQESVHQALGGGVVPPEAPSDGSGNGTERRGRNERRGWRNRLSVAEQYASSIFFGRGGGGGGSGTGSGQVLQERDD